jgi:hypothetical protein
MLFHHCLASEAFEGRIELVLDMLLEALVLQMAPPSHSFASKYRSIVAPASGTFPPL